MKDNKNRINNSYDRESLARLVIICSFLSIFSLCAVMIHYRDDAKIETVKEVFNVLLPVLASWVGTVLAFYFSSHNTAAVAEAINRQSGDTPKTSVGEVMIPINKIQGKLDLSSKVTDQWIKKDLDDRFKPGVDGGKVTRIIGTENNKFSFIIHISAYKSYLAKQDYNENDPSKDAEKVLDGMLNDHEIGPLIKEKVVFVKQSETLNDAKNALEKIKGAQDVIITDNGERTGEMLGWLSNIDLFNALSQS